NNYILSELDVNENVLREFSLSQNYPNPFNPATTIQFRIPYSQLITLKVYDVLGREVITLLNKPMQAGQHKVEWNASNFPSGVYIYRLTAGTFSDTKKMLLMK
ncbi:MAG: T9SS type A sorting domain-containing protein, partial [Ignavibacteria bacterium]|nr:T9SS type A sorting domain-containing protein [Ignavibacteria bacterium]